MLGVTGNRTLMFRDVGVKYIDGTWWEPHHRARDGGTSPCFCRTALCMYELRYVVKAAEGSKRGMRG